MKLYLACGMDRLDGYHHVDNNPACNPDQVWNLQDLSRRWPWQDVSDIQVKHYIEHIPHGTGKDHFIRFFERCWYILKPGGTMTIRWPWYASIGAFSDPTHQRFITPMTFHYLSREWLQSRKIEHYDMVCDFQIVSNTCTLGASLEGLDDAGRGRAIETQINAAHEGITVLKAIK